MYSILGWAFSFLAVWSVNEWDCVPLGLVFFVGAVAAFRTRRERRRVVRAAEPVTVEVSTEDEDDPKPRRATTAAERLEIAREAAKVERRLVALLDRAEREEYGAQSEIERRKLYASKKWRLLQYDIEQAERRLREYE